MTARLAVLAALSMAACSSSAATAPPLPGPDAPVTLDAPSGSIAADAGPDGQPVDAVVPLDAGAPGPEAGPDANLVVDAPGGLAALSDDFSSAQLAPSWQVVNAMKMTVSVSGGALHLLPTQSLLWFNASQGGLVYKTVTGDFTVTATVHPRKRSAPQSPPTETVNLGGLMARSPAPGPENYVFVVVGVDVNDFSVETKTTIEGRSTYEGPSWAPTDAELRICRVGPELRLLKRAPGTTAWMMAASYRRPDLPSTLQVGPNVYSPTARPDLDVAFDEVVFAPASTLEDCGR
jgi:hypothetical protein